MANANSVGCVPQNQPDPKLGEKLLYNYDLVHKIENRLVDVLARLIGPLPEQADEEENLLSTHKIADATNRELEKTLNFVEHILEVL